MTYTGIILFDDDVSTILGILDHEAERRKERWERARGTTNEKLAANQYCACIKAYTELDEQRKAAMRRRDYTCGVESLEEL